MGRPVRGLGILPRRLHRPDHVGQVPSLAAQPDVAGRQGSERATRWEAGNLSLPGGKYLVKVYTAQQNRLATD